VRTEEGRRIRQAFIAPKGHVLLAADYSQIELRIMAHLSGDAGLLKAFEGGLDIHRATAAEVFGLKPDAVSDERRRAAKAINFGLIYGMSAYVSPSSFGDRPRRGPGIRGPLLQPLPGREAFHGRDPGAGPGPGLRGDGVRRRLYLPEIRSKNPQLRQYAERTAIKRAHAGHRRGHHQTRHDRGAALAGRERHQKHAW